MKKTEKSQSVKIHSAALHIENKVSLRSRQSWFVLIHNAFPFLGKESLFSMPISELKRRIGYESRNNTHLKQIIRDLKEIDIEWNILGKDTEIWGVSGLLAECEINGNIIEYSIGTIFQKRFLNPKFYKKLNLLISKNFRSKHALAIYCLALDYLDTKSNSGEKNLSIPEIRKLLGLKEKLYKIPNDHNSEVIEDGEYNRTSDLHNRILKRAEQEINKNSDINISILPIQENTGRKEIQGFKLKMKVKEAYVDFYQAPPLQSTLLQEISWEEQQKEESLEITDSKLLKFFEDYKINIWNEKKRLIEIEITTEQCQNFLKDLADYLISEIPKGEIKNVGGLYISMVRDKQRLAEFLDKQKLINTKLEEKKSNENLKITKDENNKYYRDKAKNFRNYLEENFEKYLPLLVKILKQKAENNNYIKDLIHKNNFDKYILTKSSVLVLLLEEEAVFEFQFPDFENWKRDH